MDVRRCKPTELVRLLNSTPLGEVLTTPVLSKHRERAGFRIGDGRRVDLVRYAAWLAARRERKPSGVIADVPKSYELHRERMAAEQRAGSKSVRDIGPIPTVVNPRRRELCRLDLRRFAEMYHLHAFPLEWSADHLTAIRRIEQTVLEGGQFAIAMPRGSGKTSLLETAAEWAYLYGHRRFPVVIGPEKGHAELILASLLLELETNDLLLEDFPEVCFPIRALEGIRQRAGGQLSQGRPTRLKVSAEQLTLPDIPGSKSAGSVFRVAGITGQVRGMKAKLASGESIRPDLVLIDDPQTNESAKSPSQVAERERIVKGAVLGLAGPQVKIAAFAAVTVVVEDDLADRLLDRRRNPEWRGQRTSMLRAMPKRMDLWEKYDDLRRAAFADGAEEAVDPEAEAGAANPAMVAATAFYERHRGQMDLGAVASWEQRFVDGEASAIQHAMNHFLADPEMFWAEYQNQPKPREAVSVEMVDAKTICSRLNARDEGQVPAGATTLTAFIDVQQEVLIWLVAAWDQEATGHVVGYGAEPEQGRPYWTLTDAKHTLERAANGGGFEAALHSGLERLTERIVGREWALEGGGGMRVERCLIDAGWGRSTDTVYEFCRRSRHAGVLPSFGRYVGAKRQSFDSLARKKGERVGLNWRLRPPATGRPTRYVLFDANYWKSWVLARLRTAVGDGGSLSLWGRRPEQHQMLADHWTAEHPVLVEAKGRRVDEWQLRQPGLDNHLWDCIVGASVAASMTGIAASGTKAAAGGRGRKRLKLSELQKQRA